jgi:hypothetical protein
VGFSFSNFMAEDRLPLLLRIPAGLKAKLTALAEKEHRSLNKQIEYLLERAVQEESRGETEVGRGSGRPKPK